MSLRAALLVILVENISQSYISYVLYEKLLLGGAISYNYSEREREDNNGIMIWL
jgi:hypothetical protein